MTDKITENDQEEYLNININDIIKQAREHYKSKEYEKALPLFQKAAESGDQNSIFFSAYILSNEAMATPDYEKAVYYYQLLIDKGLSGAMNNLAVLYEQGKGVEINLEKAFELFKRASENGGEALEYSNLAGCYFWGKGTQKDYKKSLEACLKSCEMGGNGKAYNMLYKIYNEGLGTDRDIEKAKHYRDLALSSDDIQIVIESCLDYLKESRELLDKFKLTSKTEIVNKLQAIIERFSSSDCFLQSYLFAEIYYCLYKIQTEKWKEHNDNAMLYAKKVYEEGKVLAKHKTMQRMYGTDFFDFNMEYDYFAYDEARFNGYTIGTTRVTYVPRLEAKSNNYSIEYWLPRARLAYAMYCELENINSREVFYSNSLSVEDLENQITYKNVVYPNALYMCATRYIMGYDTEIQEDYGLYLLKLAAERYHTRSAYLYGSYCQSQGNYEEALRFYRIAISDKYPEYVQRKEALPSVLLKPGESITYSIYYEYGGEKSISYEALEDIIENYDKYRKYLSHEEVKVIAEQFLNAPYRAKKPERFLDAFKYVFAAYYDRFVEIYKNDLQALTTKKPVEAGILDAVDEKSAKDSTELALDNKSKVAEEEEIRNHPIWGYLRFNRANSAVTELVSMLCFPNRYSEKEICKCIRKYFMPLTPAKIQISEVNEIIEYAKATGQYFKCGILLLSFNCIEGLNLLTKHYMNSIDNLLKLSEVAIKLYEKQSVVYSFPYSFNKAMCLLSKGKSKGNKILKDIVSLKGTSKLEKLISKPYQPAVDFLDGKEVNDEYLLNIRSKNG